jgi:hypothetical protein
LFCSKRGEREEKGGVNYWSGRKSKKIRLKLSSHPNYHKLPIKK